VLNASTRLSHCRSGPCLNASTRLSHCRSGPCAERQHPDLNREFREEPVLTPLTGVRDRRNTGLCDAGKTVSRRERGRPYAMLAKQYRDENAERVTVCDAGKTVSRRERGTRDRMRCWQNSIATRALATVCDAGTFFQCQWRIQRALLFESAMLARVLSASGATRALATVCDAGTFFQCQWRIQRALLFESAMLANSH
jgi:hypothetical protein